MPAKKDNTVAEKEPDAKSLKLIKLLQDVFHQYKIQPIFNIDEVEVEIDPYKTLEICRIAKEDKRLKFDYLRCISVVEYDQTIQIVYHLYSSSFKHKAVLKASAAKDNPTFSSVTPVWRGAEWFEREGAELFGVMFEGHPNPKHLLLWDGFEGYPGLKSYPFAEINIPDDIEVPL